MFSDREARHSLEVSNHWSWSPGEKLLVLFFNNSEGKWSKVAALKTMFQVLSDGMNTKEREAIKNLSNRLAEKVIGRYLGAVKNP